MTPRWPMAGWVQVAVGNRMIWLLSGEILGGEPDPNPLGFVEFGVGEGGSVLWYGVVGRSLIVSSADPLLGVSSLATPFLVLLLQGLSPVRPP
jgi:hypothetical protein